MLQTIYMYHLNKHSIVYNCTAKMLQTIYQLNKHSIIYNCTAANYAVKNEISNVIYEDFYPLKTKHYYKSIFCLLTNQLHELLLAHAS